MYRLGLLLNPVAGIGGAVALKGSDGADNQALARARGGVSPARERVRQCVHALRSEAPSITYVVAPGAMGAELFAAEGWPFEVLPDVAIAEPSTAADTRAVAQALLAAAVDVVVFAGGDGTARDVCAVLGRSVPCLGIPSGVKMHSGVFAVTPVAAARVLAAMASGELVSVMDGDVRDIDEAAFRQGVVRARHFGDLLVPAEKRYVQHVKEGGREVEALVIEEIAAHVVAEMAASDATWFIGSGSTTAAVMAQLGLDNTLLGIDVVRHGELLRADATEADLLEFIAAGPCQAVVTVIGGQGHLFGRGNQQFSARVIRALTLAAFLVIATKSKLEALEGRPLVVDTGDAALDEELSGFMPIVTGFEDSVLYRLGLA